MTTKLDCELTDVAHAFGEPPIPTKLISQLNTMMPPASFIDPSTPERTWYPTSAAYLRSWDPEFHGHVPPRMGVVLLDETHTLYSIIRVVEVEKITTTSWRIIFDDMCNRMMYISPTKLQIGTILALTATPRFAPSPFSPKGRWELVEAVYGAELGVQLSEQQFAQVKWYHGEKAKHLYRTLYRLPTDHKNFTPYCHIYIPKTNLPKSDKINLGMEITAGFQHYDIKNRDGQLDRNASFDMPKSAAGLIFGMFSVADPAEKDMDTTHITNHTVLINNEEWFHGCSINHRNVIVYTIQDIPQKDLDKNKSMGCNAPKNGPQWVTQRVIFEVYQPTRYLCKNGVSIALLEDRADAIPSSREAPSYTTTALLTWPLKTHIEAERRSGLATMVPHETTRTTHMRPDDVFCDQSLHSWGDHLLGVLNKPLLRQYVYKFVFQYKLNAPEQVQAKQHILPFDQARRLQLAHMVTSLGGNICSMEAPILALKSPTTHGNLAAMGYQVDVDLLNHIIAQPTTPNTLRDVVESQFAASIIYVRYPTLLPELLPQLPQVYQRQWKSYQQRFKVFQQQYYDMYISPMRNNTSNISKQQKQKTQQQQQQQKKQQPPPPQPLPQHLQELLKTHNDDHEAAHQSLIDRLARVDEQLTSLTQSIQQNQQIIKEHNKLITTNEQTIKSLNNRCAHQREVQKGKAKRDMAQQKKNNTIINQMTQDVAKKQVLMEKEENVFQNTMSKIVKQQQIYQEQIDRIEREEELYQQQRQMFTQQKIVKKQQKQQERQQQKLLQREQKQKEKEQRRVLRLQQQQQQKQHCDLASIINNTTPNNKKKNKKKKNKEKKINNNPQHFHKQLKKILFSSSSSFSSSSPTTTTTTTPPVHAARFITQHSAIKTIPSRQLNHLLILAEQTYPLNMPMHHEKLNFLSTIITHYHNCLDSLSANQQQVLDFLTTTYETSLQPLHVYCTTTQHNIQYFVQQLVVKCQRQLQFFQYEARGDVNHVIYSTQRYHDCFEMYHLLQKCLFVDVHNNKK